MTNTTTAIVDVQSNTVNRFVEAHRELVQRLGVSPGPEFLMGLAVEQADPMEIIEDYKALIIQQLTTT